MPQITVAVLMAALEKLDPNDKVGYYDGQGGGIAATRIEIDSDRHDPSCDCGCVAISLV